MSLLYTSPLLFLLSLGRETQACNFIKKETLAKVFSCEAQVFSCEFCEISKNTLFAENLRTTASPIN